MLSFFFTKTNGLGLIIALLSCFLLSAYSYAKTEKAFYLRAAIGVAFSQDTQFADADCQSTSPAALFGCAIGNDDKEIGADGDFGESGLIDIGFGYLWNEWFQTELSLTYRPDFKFNGQSNFKNIDTDFSQTVEADMNNFSAMVVAVIKPLPLFKMNDWIVEPLFTAGLGIAHNRIDPMVYTFPHTSTTTPSGNHTDFAWSVGAGFAYALTDSIDLEILYRYSDLGKVYTDVDTMTVLSTTTNTIITDSIVIDKTEADLEVNELVLGIVWYY